MDAAARDMVAANKRHDSQSLREISLSCGYDWCLAWKLVYDVLWSSRPAPINALMRTILNFNPVLDVNADSTVKQPRLKLAWTNVYSSRMEHHFHLVPEVQAIRNALLYRGLINSIA